MKKFIKGIINREFLISISCLMLVQEFNFYFVKFVQNNYHTLLTVVDEKIPFIPYFIYPYNIFYPFVFLCFYYTFTKDKEKYYQGIIAGIIGFMICTIIYIIYPTVMIRPDIINADLLTKLIIDITYKIDTPALNCFPSIHCLFCFQTIYTTYLSKKIPLKNKNIILTISLLIILSTLFVKQHYVYDLIASLVLCLLCNFIVYLFKLDKYVYKNR